MIQAYLKTSLPISALFSVTILLATSAGSHRSLPEALNGFDECHLPCWNQITPEQTTTDIASILLAEAGYEIRVNNPHWRYMVFAPPVKMTCNVALTYETLVRMTELNECTGLTLGDITAILGAPQQVVPSAMYDSFIFRDGTVTVLTRRIRCSTGLSPHAVVMSIHLRASSRGQPESESPRHALPWRGFVPLWHYDKRFWLTC
jgi:hypothetical protein